MVLELVAVAVMFDGTAGMVTAVGVVVQPQLVQAELPALL
jgi:hypothetical protein